MYKRSWIWYAIKIQGNLQNANTYSNCKAAIFDGNPVTIQVISFLQLDKPHHFMRTLKFNVPMVGGSPALF